MNKHKFKSFISILLVVGCFNLVFAAEGRHALIIGIGEYSEASNTPTLEGIPKDMENARRMAKEMGISNESIVELRDSQATKANIQSEFKKLADKVKPGDRVFIYHSGHGARYPQGNICVEGLQTYTKGRFTVADVFSEADIASYTKPISEKADKVLMVIDTCFSGGVLNTNTRSLSPALKIRPKSNPNNQKCDVAVNQVKTRGLLSELKRFGIYEENFVQIAAANKNEFSWDTKELGGLATHSLTQCLTGEATDLNKSGAISLEEVRACAQLKLNTLMKPHEKLGMLPSNIQVKGNRNLIPVAVLKPPAEVTPPPQQVVQAPPSSVVDPPKIQLQPIKLPDVVVAQVPINDTPPSAPNTTAVVADLPKPPEVIYPVEATPQVQVDPPKKPAVVNAPPPFPEKPKPPIETIDSPTTPASLENLAKPADLINPEKTPSQTPAATPPKKELVLASLATLQDIEQQRNPKRKLEVKLTKPILKIAKDKLELTIKSSHDGYVYLVLLGSDAKSFYILYPNGLDMSNRIKAGVPLKLPRPDWQIKAAGPAGSNNLLVMVSDTQRILDKLTIAEPTAAEPFTFSLNTMSGRSALVNYLTGSGIGGRSESFGAKLMTIKEVE